MTASTIYNSYSIALPSVQVAGTVGRGLIARWIEALACRITRSIIDQPAAASSAIAPAHWRTEAALRQQGMREWLATQPQHGTGATSAQQAHKELWLELVG